MGRKTRWGIGLAMLIAAAGLFMFLRFSSFAAQDACLDSGGAWHDGGCVR